tara:strand:- start:27 stop:239 length:213 start_codon:yes stop_codon:yes gene_type:complete
MDKNEMLSLYDYLGHAAGAELGKKIATIAAKEKVGFKTKSIKTPYYEGDIMMYPKDFLERQNLKINQHSS